jgi:hypothetical protein
MRVSDQLFSEGHPQRGSARTEVFAPKAQEAIEGDSLLDEESDTLESRTGIHFITHPLKASRKPFL